MNQVVPPKPKFNLITLPEEPVSSDVNYAPKVAISITSFKEPHYTGLTSILFVTTLHIAMFEGRGFALKSPFTLIDAPFPSFNSISICPTISPGWLPRMVRDPDSLR